MRRTLISIAVTGALVAMATSPASAASSIVAVPQHRTAVGGLTLLGASARGVVAAQAPMPDNGNTAERVFSGAEGTRLVRRPVMEGTSFSLGAPDVVTVSGDTIAWARTALPGACDCDWQVVHRTNVRTGADRYDGVMPPPSAFTQNSWLSNGFGSYSQFPLPPAALKRYTPPATPPATGDASYLPSTVITANPDLADSIAMDADGATALIAYSVLSDPNDSDSPRIYHLDLLNLTTGALTPVTQTSDVITRVALSDNLIVWDSTATGESTQINQRARSGGPTTSYTAAEGIVADTKLVIAGPNVGYLAPVAGSSVLRIVTGTTAQTVVLPAGSAGLATDGTRFLTATGGSSAIAGVYGVPETGDGGATRVATMPPATFALSNVTLSGSQLHYTDASRTDRPGQPLWMRTVSGHNHPKLGAETLMNLPTGSGAATYAGFYTAFSDGRAAVSDPSSDAVRLFDQDAETGIVTDPAGGAPNVSGPYTLINGDVYRPDGEKVYSVPLFGDNLEYSDIYGSSVIYSEQDPDTQDLKIFLDDVENSDPILLATIPGQSGDSYCIPEQVSIWADTAAWTNCDWTGMTVENLTTKATRTVPAGDTGTVAAMALGEGVLGWSTDAATYVLDLTSAGSQAVQVSGAVLSFALDDHRIALATYLGHGPGDPVLIEQLPFDVRYRPRLIGTYATRAFAPGGRHRWTPQFDISKPVRSVELTITDSGGGKIAVLDGTGPDGSIRDLSWNGQDRQGDVVPAGDYTWTLTARADDGDGRLIGPRGESSVTGSIEIDSGQ